MIAFPEARAEVFGCSPAATNGDRLAIYLQLASGRTQLQGNRKTMIEIARSILTAAGTPDARAEEEERFVRALDAWRARCGVKNRKTLWHHCRAVGVNYFLFRAWLPQYEAFEQQACDQRIICALSREAA